MNQDIFTTDHQCHGKNIVIQGGLCMSRLVYERLQLVVSAECIVLTCDCAAKRGEGR